LRLPPRRQLMCHGPWYAEYDYQAPKW
jgi:hypothetical protein